ncbi:MAG: phosphoglucosamine mutase [Christensenellaceae bacterium]|jgi:phosphoglucosamine mutase|nr:phosphoglucosamine mutase [Christensenellaceae bacterium]
MARLFGTDGVRGVANRDLTCDLAMRIGRAGAHVLTSEVRHPRIVVGRDTRRSGDMLSAALTAGICSVGGDVIDVGILPTPALAYLVRLYGADAAVMVSASHNTMEYNGIKWFNGEGFKLSDALEDEIECLLSEGAQFERPEGAEVGHVITARRAREEYKTFLKATASTRFEGITVALDCANGAASGIAQDVFNELGAQVISCADEPDGSNINEHCGSTHPERLQELVEETGADVGFAFDGDADRVIATDERGNIVDGDRMLGICAAALKKEGKLKGDTLVITAMSNIGLKRKMQELGIAVAETAVGDRYVLECMRAQGYCLGGEQSGHVIFLNYNSTGDGILTAIQTLNVLIESRQKMSALAAQVPIYPQVLVNVAVDNAVKEQAMEDAELRAKIAQISDVLGEGGRIFVRASGTEPLIRIMLEGQDEEVLERLAGEAARILKRKYNGRVKE